MEHWSCATVAVLFNFVAYTDQLLHHGQCTCGVKYRLMKLADNYIIVCVCVTVCDCVCVSTNMPCNLGLGNIKVFSHHTIFIHSDMIYCCIQKKIEIPYVNKLYNWSLK